jgi:hypothetical protein
MRGGGVGRADNSAIPGVDACYCGVLVEGLRCYIGVSFPRSAWECSGLRSSAKSYVAPGRGAVAFCRFVTRERQRMHSHAERGNEG